MKRFVAVFMVLAVGLGVALWWKLGEQRAEARRPPGSSGVLEGTRVVVSARLAARIKALHAVEGQPVEAGALLAELDCADLDAGLFEGEARVAAAKAQVEPVRAQARAAAAQVEAVRRQAEAAKRQAEASKAQIGALRAQRQNVRLQRDRAATLYGEQIIPTSTVEGLEATTQELAYRASAASAAAGAAESAAAAAEGQVQAATEQAQAAAEQVRALESQLAVAQAALERARVALRECRIVAPRSGVVTLRAREPGEVVLPGSTLFEITDSAELTVTFYVANAHLGRVAVGAKVDAIADAYPGQRFPGVVRRVSPEAEFTPRNIQTRSDRDRLVYAVEAVLENPGGRLRVGMPVEVVVVEAKR